MNGPKPLCSFMFSLFPHSFRYMCEALLDLNGIKPFETNTARLSTFAAQGAQTPQAGPSSSTSGATSSRSKGNAARKRPNSSEIIDIDDDETVRTCLLLHAICLRAKLVNLPSSERSSETTSRGSQSAKESEDGSQDRKAYPIERCSHRLIRGLI